MSVIGLGTDIVEIARITQACAGSDRLARRVLTDYEMGLFQQDNEPSRYLAKRWAAKEAAAKALGTGIGRGISFQHFEIRNNDLGAPKLTLTLAAKQRADDLGVKSALLSISDEQNYAMATVILS
ncbi:holo-ACP synthase [Psychrosphaera sp. B3R10]|uniref:holo-ACP synthase n=1 Tax=unclassified Psychrosphaera TaxID=2641570 RepID=UPI001C096941|nr:MULTISPECIES: holo-ACP synthase [unclassified Psychrosphaera]MBU2882970.1 holo-ACP synthase [Psychrosphaera sp. I2R16]MBU2991367.1 holo-ACP synthase [Psychrosphaera sp. B3R10]MDO6720256.1 holo-ACP synthase [Psychrosphaera sp. 1_MG-2023]